MTNLTGLLAQGFSDENGPGRPRRSVLLVQAAASLYDRSWFRSRFMAAIRRLGRRPNSLLALADVDPCMLTTPRFAVGIQTVPLCHIRGSEGRSRDFDAEFRPTVATMRQRWIGVALAWMDGAGLPPIDLIKVGDVYYVRDGHHRVSVARALGNALIEANVVVWACPETAKSKARIVAEPELSASLAG